jgi:hypothetical protein
MPILNYMYLWVHWYCCCQLARNFSALGLKNFPLTAGKSKSPPPGDRCEEVSTKQGNGKSMINLLGYPLVIKIILGDDIYSFPLPLKAKTKFTVTRIIAYNVRYVMNMSDTLPSGCPNIFPHLTFRWRNPPDQCYIVLSQETTLLGLIIETTHV